MNNDGVKPFFSTLLETQVQSFSTSRKQESENRMPTQTNKWPSDDDESDF